ncbi:hypothetical protein AJ80_05090 [Polytolypa hystricis UAMH7299]|uniref:DUF8035 domain-containing protein n=1 Tax=Polytolypa hystricis (strain UAMH7299) TaxID=1447883 RepID=A0A2B7Y6D9_POLH7|nr:hypothetical protein AJ80_05090 [Polytolypa hystricis UAMH7299]
MSRRPPDRELYERDRYDRRGPGRSDFHDHTYEQDVQIRQHQRAPDPPRVREMERVRERDRSPDFLREKFARSSSAGPLVHRPRPREDWEYEYLPSHGAVERERERETEETIMRRPRRSPPREVERERDELLVRRRERSRPPREPQLEREREELIMRRDREYGTDEESIPPPRPHRMRERDDFHFRAVSRERASPRANNDDRGEIIIRKDEREGPRGRNIERNEIIIRREEERSSSPEMPQPPPMQRHPPPVHAPPIHQNIITHHHHLDHGFEVVPRPAVPEPPTAQRDEFDEIEVRRRRDRDSRCYEDEIAITRKETNRSPPRRRPTPRFDEEDELIISHTSSTRKGPDRERDRERDMLVIRDRETNRDHRDVADIREEAAYYSRRANEGSRIGEAYNGATRDWSIVDVPPGTKRVTLDGVGGASQEVSWQRYNGVRRSKFIVEGDEYCAPSSDREKSHGRVGRRYVGVREKRDELWTEITKDLVVKEAIEKLGFEYEETEYFFYIFAYLRYEDVSTLVSYSEDFRCARRDRIREIQRERTTFVPPPLPAPCPPSPPPQVLMIDNRPEERVYERDVVIEEERRTRNPVLVRKRW